jgi:hypothetical protein
MDRARKELASPAVRPRVRCLAAGEASGPQGNPGGDAHVKSKRVKPLGRIAGSNNIPIAGSVPCHDSICDKSIHRTQSPRPLLSRNSKQANERDSGYKRRVYALQINILDFIARHGLAFTAYVTITFASKLEPCEAQKIWNSLLTNFIRPNYGEAIVVREFGKSGRIHITLLVPVGVDIRSGCDFGGFTRRDYHSAPDALKALWRVWRTIELKYGLGRCEVMPIKTDAFTVAQYLSKELGSPTPDGGRIRRISYVGLQTKKVANSNFTWAGGRSKQYREKVGGFVTMMADNDDIAAPTFEAMCQRFGRSWSMQFSRDIENFPADDPSSWRPPITYEELRKLAANARRRGTLDDHA